MKRFLRLTLCLVLTAVLFTGAACKKDPPPGSTAPQGITIDNTQTTVTPGSFDISATVTPAGADQRYNVTVLGAPNGITVSGKTVTVARTAENGLQFTVKAVSLLDLTVSATKSFTVDNPPAAAVEIRTPQQLAAIADDLEGNYVLKNDIDLGSATWTPIGTADFEDDFGHIVTYGEGFAGRLNGNGYTIRNFAFDDGDAVLAGLFAQIQSTGVVERLGIEGTLRAKNWSGAIAGLNHGTIRNCFVDVEVTGTGFPISAVAGNNKGLVQNTLAIGRVSCPDGKDGAGFVGSTDGTVEKSFAHAGNIPYAYGWAKTPDPVISRSQSQLKAAATYAAWDHENIWYIADGSYPLLRYQGFVPPQAQILVTVTNTERSLNLRASPAQNSLQIAWTVTNAQSQAVTFRLKESVPGVSVDADGVLRLTAEAADNARATVVVTSVEDPSKFAEYTVKINNFDPAAAIGIGSYDDLLGYLINTDDPVDLTKRYILTNDLDLSTIMWNTMIGANVDGDGAFTGTFDGNGYKLSGVAGGNMAANFGLFKRIGAGGTVRNLAIKIREHRIYVGNDSAVLASVNDGTVENCVISGEIMGTNANVAGFVFANNGTIRNCVSLLKILPNEGTSPAGTRAIADTNAGTIEGVFVDKEVTGASQMLSAANAALDANCLATAAMQTARTFAGFDEGVWLLTDGGYPVLKHL